MCIVNPHIELSKFNYKRYSIHDRVRLRDLRFRFRKLWLPEREPEIREWQKRLGINNSGAIVRFAQMNRSEKEQFFGEAEQFLDDIDLQIQRYYQEILDAAFLSEIDEYKVLGVTREDPLREIKKQYHKLLFQHHPDYGGRAEFFIKIHHAYQKVIQNMAGEERKTEAQA